ncbi:MFS general substrate transporter [Trametopsis cervina]|nr:MFS general substrate transporter [Trametopsis cervina]
MVDSPSTQAGSSKSAGELDIYTIPATSASTEPIANLTLRRTNSPEIQHVTIIRHEKFDEMSKSRIALILFSLGLCTFLYAIEQTIVATAVSSIGAGVKATSSLTWISTSYLLTTAVFQPLTGRLSDVFGTKRMLVCEVWIFIFGNIISGTSHNLTQLVAGRLITGLGAAGLLSLCTIVVSRE